MTGTTKIAFVTGGSRGLGRATVEALAKRGVGAILTHQNNKQGAEDVVSLLKEAGVPARAIQLDVTETSSFAGLASEVRTQLSEWGLSHFDYLVNMAGSSHTGTLADTNEAEFDRVYAEHLKGPFFLTQALLPLLRDGGRIVNISTGLTRILYPGRIAYGSMKGAVEVMTRYMAKELGSRRIAVNTVAPGAIQTDFSGGMVRDNPEITRHITEATALGRPGVPDDIGPMIASLLGEEGRWINAQRIEVSGGQSL
ncbi:SDR family NAD(P)-dependent oxidoreductase [Asaia astilbis]|uniref:SDR family NAD(P)-dependent oxidoreductase n=1 Tax=Asaia astilbis TaxID=610244 RepID=UPI000472A85C|nr:SDR family oxidoreductase [Asaia astilbis]